MMEMYLKVMLFNMMLKYVIFCGNRIPNFSQATVEVYIIQSSIEKYFIILLN